MKYGKPKKKGKEMTKEPRRKKSIGVREDRQKEKKRKVERTEKKGKRKTGKIGCASVCAPLPQKLMAS